MNKTLKNAMLVLGGASIGAYGMLRFVEFAFGWKADHLKEDRDAIYELKGLDKTLVVLDGITEAPHGVRIAFVVDDK